MALKYVNEIDFKGKRVVARFDFNVPLAKDGSGKITDTTRVDSALPTIRHILENGASKLVLMSHLGRPDGQINKKYSLKPVAEYLANALKTEVILTETAIDAGVRDLLNLPTSKVVLLENVRFHAEEEDNDPEFAKKLASYGEIYVNDAFGTSHRKHASTYGIVAHVAKGNAVGGFLMKKEVDALMNITDHPKKPLAAVVGGAKVSDKIKTIEALLKNVENMLIGGAMAYPFLKAKGFTVGKSLCSDDDVELAKKILAQPSASKLVLPVDHIVSDSLEGAPKTNTDVNIEENMIGLDIGPKTRELYASKLKSAKTIFWNGPMGLFENKNFAEGTMSIAKVMSELNDAFTLVGGGDSVSAVNKSGFAGKISHISTGGGASLEFIENGSLPGVQALRFGI